MANGTETEIILRDGSLYATDLRLYPIKPDCFFEYKYFGDVCFVRDADGKAKEINWKGTNFNLTWTKK